MAINRMIILGVVSSVSCSNWVNQFPVLGEVDYTENYFNNNTAWAQFDAYMLDSSNSVKIKRYKSVNLYVIIYEYESSRKIVLFDGKKIYHILFNDLKFIGNNNLILRRKSFDKFDELELSRTTHGAARIPTIAIPPS